jgi:SNF2 family DNA or RNA helicase
MVASVLNRGDQNLGALLLVGSKTDVYSTLRQYQLEGAHFLASHDMALLADGMGLGKTIQTAVALALNQTIFRRVLIVAPASLCLNWQRELKKWAPNLVVRRMIGDANDRAATYRLPIKVLIASYEQIRSDIHRLDSTVIFDVAILDEAQRIKNTASDTSLACRLIPRKRSWALSGTPLENRPSDLISIFRFLKPGLLHRSMSRAELHQNIANFFLRRVKQEVLTELPPIIVQDIHIEMGKRQRKAYDDIWASRFDYERADSAPINLLATLTRLKQVCNFDAESGESTKVDTLNVIEDSICQETDKLLLFSQYVESLEFISGRMNLPHEILHGRLSQTERDLMIARFCERRGPRALLVSIKAGGVGLNLQAASTVVLFDRWWNPAIEKQAIERAHRYGREGPLQVIRFLTLNSIEERIQELVIEKEDLFAEYVEKATSAKSKAPSYDALRRILEM